MIAATGPNTSSSCAGCPGVTSASTVGGYQAPGWSGTVAAEQQPRAVRERSPHLRVDLVARVDALQRPEPGAGSRGSPIS